MSATWVILVNYKGADDTIECVESLKLHAQNALVVVVDNGSGDDSAARIRSAYPSIRVIESPTNLGFTGGNNLAIREALAAGVEFIWLLNNDTVIEAGALDELLRVMRSDERIGILTPRIDYYDSPGVPWFVGSRMDLSRGEAVHDNSRLPDDVVEVPWITGCAMFCRAEMLRQTGGFDDRYFLNWEDVDLSVRAAKLGWKLKLAPNAVVRHKVSRSLARSPSRATYYWHRNRLLVTSTHAGQAAARAVRRDSRRHAIRALWHWKSAALETWRTIGRAIADARCGRYGAMLD